MTDMTTTFHKCIEFDVTTSLKCNAMVATGRYCAIDVVSAVLSLIATTAKCTDPSGRMADLATWRTLPGPRMPLSVQPFGISPGILQTALEKPSKERQE
jgi:hypothetical protein